MDNTGQQPQPHNPVPGNTIVSLTLTVDFVNILIKLLDESSLPHNQVKQLASTLVGQTVAQINLIQAEMNKPHQETLEQQNQNAAGPKVVESKVVPIIREAKELLKDNAPEVDKAIEAVGEKVGVSSEVDKAIETLLDGVTKS